MLSLESRAPEKILENLFTQNKFNAYKNVFSSRLEDVKFHAMN